MVPGLLCLTMPLPWNTVSPQSFVVPGLLSPRTPFFLSKKAIMVTITELLICFLEAVTGFFLKFKPFLALQILEVLEYLVEG